MSACSCDQPKQTLLAMEQAQAALAARLPVRPPVEEVSLLAARGRVLANLLTAGDEKPVKLALKRLLAMRVFKRSQHVEGEENLKVLEEVGLTRALAEDMYRYLAIANYEDRYVIPTAHREESLSEVFAERNGCGFSFGSGCNGESDTNMFGAKKATRRDVLKTVQIWEE